MFAVIYRWRLVRDSRDEFIAAWQALTERIAETFGSLGSRLHEEPDGTMCAIALWPDRERWETARFPHDDAMLAEMRSYIEGGEAPITMDLVADCWRREALPLREGFTDVPAGLHANVVTNLQMLERPANIEAAMLPFHLERMAPVDLERYRALFKAVGEPYRWFSRLRLTNDELNAIINDRAVEVYAASDGTRDIGLLELDFRRARECEITFFGFIESTVGRGYGAALMRFALAQAWSHPIQRLWLHTCTNDHPSALAFYQRHGFAPYSTQIELYT